MKHFKVTVNGNSYDVAVEEVSPGTPQTQPLAQPQPLPVKTPAVTASKTVDSPMSGKIIALKVKSGESVSVNQTVVILEAMKMENEIVTPYAGTVASINVTNGQTVDSGDVLITLS